MILDEIVKQTKNLLDAQPRAKFFGVLEQPKTNLICEVKLKSPPHPEPFIDNPQDMFDIYKRAGVDGISVVTNDDFFGGSNDLVLQAQATGLPVLRKDFIIETRQIGEVKADALLLIFRIVSPDILRELVNTCLKLDID